MSATAAKKKVLLFAPAAHNLAEVTRALEMAKACRSDFEPVFLSYDGTRRNRRFIEQEGFTIRDLEPHLTEETPSSERRGRTRSITARSVHSCPSAPATGSVGS